MFFLFPPPPPSLYASFFSFPQAGDFGEKTDGGDDAEKGWAELIPIIKTMGMDASKS